MSVWTIPPEGRDFGKLRGGLHHVHKMTGIPLRDIRQVMRHIAPYMISRLVKGAPTGIAGVGTIYLQFRKSRKLHPLQVAKLKSHVLPDGTRLPQKTHMPDMVVVKFKPSTYLRANLAPHQEHLAAKLRKRFKGKSPIRNWAKTYGEDGKRIDGLEKAP